MTAAARPRHPSPDELTAGYPWPLTPLPITAC